MYCPKLLTFATREECEDWIREQNAKPYELSEGEACRPSLNVYEPIDEVEEYAVHFHFRATDPKRIPKFGLVFDDTPLTSKELGKWYL